MQTKNLPPALPGDSSGCEFSTSHLVALNMSLIKCSCHNNPHLLLTLLDQTPLSTSISRWKWWMLKFHKGNINCSLCSPDNQKENKEEVFFTGCSKFFVKCVTKMCYQHFWFAEFSSCYAVSPCCYLAFLAVQQISCKKLISREYPDIWFNSAFQSGTWGSSSFWSFLINF